jgi:hypothetical protein
VKASDRNKVTDPRKEGAMTLTNENTRDTASAASPRETVLRASRTTSAELRWFFNEAESATDLPSNFRAIAGVFSNSLEAVEERAEAMHAADKIRGWLQALPPGFARVLESLYTERVVPPRAARVLGRVAGVVEDSPVVRMEHVRALATARTRAETVRLWLEELVEKAVPAAVADWKRDAERRSALAVQAYEHVRGSRPCVVPGDGEEDR